MGPNKNMEVGEMFDVAAEAAAAPSVETDDVVTSINEIMEISE